MAKWRRISSVLRNFLGTYASRYSSFHGYWLFGFVVQELKEMRISLLESSDAVDDAVLDVLRHVACIKCDEQLVKAGLSRAYLKSAWLTLSRYPEEVRIFTSGPVRQGYKISLKVGVVMHNDRQCDYTQALFVAPHDPNLESQSAA